MERLTHERVNGIKTGYWSAATKEVLVQKLAAYENTGYELLPAVQSFDFKCFPTLFVPENCQIPEVVCCLLRWDFSRSGSSHGSK